MQCFSDMCCYRVHNDLTNGGIYFLFHSEQSKSTKVSCPVNAMHPLRSGRHLSCVLYLVLYFNVSGLLPYCNRAKALFIVKLQNITLIYFISY